MSEPLTPLSHRRTPVETALRNAEAMLAQLDLRADVTTVAADDPYPTHYCVLRDNDGQIASASSGKGKGRQALASALFESIEHYLLSWDKQCMLNPALRSHRLHIKELASDERLRRDRMLMRMFTDHSDIQLQTWTYGAVGDSTPQALEYPVFVTDPGYQHHPINGDEIGRRPYLKYGTSSGTASGNSTTEALVHGITELVERDAMSYALIRWFRHSEGPVRVVDRASLTSDLRSLVVGAEREIGREVVIFDLTREDLPVPTYAAAAREHPSPISPVGSGTSLVPTYAAERALTELLQTHRMVESDAEMADSDLKALDRVRRYPFMHAAARFDVGALLQSLSSHPVGLRPASSDALQPQETLDSLLSHLGSAGIQPHFRLLTAASDPVTVVNVIAPGIERYASVRNGQPVLPSGDGATIWNRLSAESSVVS